MEISKERPIEVLHHEDDALRKASSRGIGSCRKKRGKGVNCPRDLYCVEMMMDGLILTLRRRPQSRSGSPELTLVPPDFGPRLHLEESERYRRVSTASSSNQSTLFCPRIFELTGVFLRDRKEGETRGGRMISFVSFLVS